MRILLLIFLAIELSKASSSNKDAGVKDCKKISSVLSRLTFHTSTGHPLASAEDGPGDRSKRGIECQAGKDKTFIFRYQPSSYFNLFIPYLKHIRVNFHTGGLLGEYEVEGCKGTSPTLVLERDQTYTMIQASHSIHIFHLLRDHGQFTALHQNPK